MIFNVCFHACVNDDAHVYVNDFSRVHLHGLICIYANANDFHQLEYCLIQAFVDLLSHLGLNQIDLSSKFCSDGCDAKWRPGDHHDNRCCASADE